MSINEYSESLDTDEILEIGRSNNRLVFNGDEEDNCTRYLAGLTSSRSYVLKSILSMQKRREHFCYFKKQLDTFAIAKYTV